MSTRSVIARGTPEDFVGVYHHWDGYPTALGVELFNLINGKYKGDLTKFLGWAIDKHKSGWSTIMGSSESDNKPECFCHPKRENRKAQRANLLTNEDIEEDIEWLYIFNESTRIMYVVRNSDTKPVITVSLDTFQPDWEKIECGCNFEYCSHYAWKHFPELQDGPSANLSTAAYLGFRPFQCNDAIAVIVNDVRYTLTGSGYSASYRKSNYNIGPVPPGTWISSVEDADGFRKELPTMIRTGNKTVAYPGVTLVFPPTKANPNETMSEPHVPTPKVIIHVWSQSKSNLSYDITIDPVTGLGTCSCLDFRFRGGVCKHMRKLNFTVKFS